MMPDQAKAENKAIESPYEGKTALDHMLKALDAPRDRVATLLHISCPGQHIA
jgi:hypothetical protein